MNKFRDEELKPCPFCGKEPFRKSYDRLIVIGCKECEYRRGWHGLITPDEYYNPKANEQANKEWNKRAKQGD